MRDGGTVGQKSKD